MQAYLVPNFWVFLPNSSVPSTHYSRTRDTQMSETNLLNWVSNKTPRDLTYVSFSEEPLKPRTKIELN